MDERTLKALKSFTNLGYALGFCPYKFITTGPQHELTTDVEDFEDENKGLTKRCGHFFQERLQWGFSKFENIFHRSNTKIGSNWTFTQPSGSRRWKLLLSIGLHWSYQCFLMCRFIQSILYGESISTKDKLEISYLTGILFLHNTFIWLLVRDFGVHATYLNSVKNTLDLLIERHKSLFPLAWSRTADRGTINRYRAFRPQSIKIFFNAASMMVILTGFGRGLKVLKNPDSLFFITSVSKDPKGLPIWIKILAGMFHCHVMGFTAYMSTFLGTTLAWYSSVMVFAVELTRLSTENSATRCRRNGNVESLHNKVEPAIMYFLQNTYYRLTSLQNNLKTCYDAVPLGAELISIFVIVFNMFVAIVYHDLSALPKSLVMAYLLKVFLSKLAEIHTVSEQVGQSWKMNRYERHNITWFSKFLNSVQSLRIYVGSFFFVDKKLILTVVAVIINLTTNLILSVK